MPAIGPLEILVVLVVAILVLPPDKIPDAARQVGKTIAAFRRFQSTMTQDFEKLVSAGEAERDPTPTLPPKQSDPEPEPGSEPDGATAADPSSAGPNGSGPDRPPTPATEPAAPAEPETSGDAVSDLAEQDDG